MSKCPNCGHEIKVKYKKVILPSFLDINVWEAYKEMRVKKKKPLTDFSTVRIINKMKKFHSKGLAVNECLAVSVDKGWPDIYESVVDQPKVAVSYNTYVPPPEQKKVVCTPAQEAIHKQIFKLGRVFAKGTAKEKVDARVEIDRLKKELKEMK